MTFLPIAEYTRDSIESATPKDPINLVFAGSTARPMQVLSLVRDRLGCKTDKFVGDQYFYEPFDPVISHRQDFNQTDAWFSGSGRLHTRVYQVFTEDPMLGRIIASPIHIDRISGCGDVAASFDLARDFAVNILRAAGLGATYLSIGRPDLVRQCNGQFTPWDGRVAAIGPVDFLRALGLELS